MTKVFWEDPYLAQLTTTVESVQEDEVVFAGTIAFAQSGGQESDRGTVNGIPISSARLDKDTHRISYILPVNHGLAEGDKVTMEIDWVRRNRLMRLHFACELVLVILNRFYGEKAVTDELSPEEIDTKILKRGAHMSEDQARIDFAYEGDMSEIIPMILATFVKIIDENYPIETGFLDKETEKRYWRIKGLATVPCGGTHVRSTKEVGYVSIRRKRPNKGIERLYITLDNPEPTSSPTVSV